MTTRVAIVTGANKGIGSAIVETLCKQFDGDVILTGRSEERCKAAVAQLQEKGLSPKYYTLDIDDSSSITKLKEFVNDNYGGIDILVNNAGISNKVGTIGERATTTCGTNYFGTLNVCNTLFPLLKPHARVVNVSSMASQEAISKCSEEMRSKFKQPNITMDELTALIQQFIDAAQNDDHEKQGFFLKPYGMSKLEEDIIVNACCPGYVATDMTLNKGPKTKMQGADTPVYLALLPPGTSSPKGDFVSERTIENWG
ncbi:CBR1 [Mytilus edulis]|uniref:carbonyl reductase (NADPH) n=1 Tax=Mytilus edulis TaxID=6550 RepID=A0A8S3U6P3_MYTED|nr:CBR1 [Mytilus edulis]